jgi:hypothetical protein
MLWILQTAASETWPRKFLLERHLLWPRPKPTSVWSLSRQPGLGAESVSIRDIYSRAEQFGLGLAPAEVGPALRLHYFDQPIGEFLHVGMKPITTWTGEPGIFVVANGGARLILIGQNGGADTQMPASSAFLFVRPREPPTLAKKTRRRKFDKIPARIH